MSKTSTLQQGVNYAEPCVAVMKFRASDGDTEVWDNWCIKHHHWLNGAPAGSVIDSLIASVKP